MAPAGGVSIVPAEWGHLCHLDDRCWPDGRCRAHDGSAAGAIRGSGGAVMLLKRLPDALCITGGLGEIVVTLDEDLTPWFRARLMLLGRSGTSCCGATGAAGGRPVWRPR